jgi:hypothetical protein
LEQIGRWASGQELVPPAARGRLRTFLDEADSRVAWADKLILAIFAVPFVAFTVGLLGSSGATTPRAILGMVSMFGSFAAAFALWWRRRQTMTKAVEVVAHLLGGSSCLDAILPVVDWMHRYWQQPTEWILLEPGGYGNRIWSAQGCHGSLSVMLLVRRRSPAKRTRGVWRTDILVAGRSGQAVRPEALHSIGALAEQLGYRTSWHSHGLHFGALNTDPALLAPDRVVRLLTAAASAL